MSAALEVEHEHVGKQKKTFQHRDEVNFTTEICAEKVVRSSILGQMYNARTSCTLCRKVCTETPEKIGITSHHSTIHLAYTYTFT